MIRGESGCLIRSFEMKSKDSFIISFNQIFTLESSQMEIFSIASGKVTRTRSIFQPGKNRSKCHLVWIHSYFFSFRVSLTLSCPMTLELFPLDTQVCFLRVASCKYLSFASIQACNASLRIRFYRWLDHKRCHLYLEITWSRSICFKPFSSWWLWTRWIY